MINMAKKGEAVKFINYTGKIKSLFMSYVNFKSISMPEKNRKQNPEDFLQIHIKIILVAVMVTY